MLNISTIEEASRYLKPKILQTPLEPSTLLSRLLKVPVFLKLEFLQRTGSFKFRGGLYAISLLTEEQKKKGIATCSAGNHGLALAYAASQSKIPCTIFVPASVDLAKFEKLKQIGSDVRRSPFSGWDETLKWSLEIIERNNLHFISAYNDEHIMTANGGTLAQEILEEIPDASHFIIPCGGGGLSAGFAFYAKSKKPSCQIIACQHEGSAALKMSVEKGTAVTQLPPCDTIAGAIEGGLGELCFGYLKDRIHHVSLISEEEIFSAVRWMLANHQYLIEPASAVPIAACLKGDIPQLEGPTVLILTGRNVSLETIQKIVMP